MNFYGSPREFSELPDEYDDLNLGKVSSHAKLDTTVTKESPFLSYWKTDVNFPIVNTRDKTNDVNFRN